jgi:hypothetical protein
MRPFYSDLRQFKSNFNKIMTKCAQHEEIHVENPENKVPEFLSAAAQLRKGLVKLKNNKCKLRE